MPPGWWHIVQFLYRMGATSSANVGSALRAESTFGCRASAAVNTASPIPAMNVPRAAKPLLWPRVGLCVGVMMTN